MRRKSKKVKVGNIFIGGDSPITVQSMTNTDTRNIDATIKQILMLEKEGCEIIRAAVPDLEAAEAIRSIKKILASLLLLIYILIIILQLNQLKMVWMGLE